MKRRDDLGNRMKKYEGRYTEMCTLPNAPVCIRIDGKNFSRLTASMERPYDPRFSKCMITTCKHLVEQTNAVIGYTQSDEISLILWNFEKPDSEIYFNGKISKLNSVLASAATSYFYSSFAALFPELADAVYPPQFDCRTWDVPTPEEAVNTLVWREIDATKNSVSMAARNFYAHSDIMFKGRADMMDMLMAKGVNWNNYPDFFKRGTYVKKIPLTLPLIMSEEERKKLPPKHILNTNPEVMTQTSDMRELVLPPILRIWDRVGTLIYGENLKEHIYVGVQNEV